MLKEDLKDKVVTVGYLDETLNTFKGDLIKEMRIMIHNALMESLENAKVYYHKETQDYIKAITDEWKDERRAFYDYMNGVKDTQDNHEKRISVLEYNT